MMPFLFFGVLCQGNIASGMFNPAKYRGGEMIHSGRSYNCFSFCLSFSCAVLSKASGIISYAGLIGTSFAIRMNFLQDAAALVFQRAWAFESPVRHKNGHPSWMSVFLCYLSSFKLLITSMCPVLLLSNPNRKRRPRRCRISTSAGQGVRADVPVI